MDPLTVDRGHLPQLCDCDPAARHSLRCELSPIFYRTLLDGDPPPDHLWLLDPPDPFDMGRWVCFNRQGAGYEPHYGGPINGPDHFCGHRMVGPDSGWED